MKFVVFASIIALLASCAPADLAQSDPEPIIFSYSYGTRGAQTMPFGDDGPIVLTCEEYYRMD